MPLVPFFQDGCTILADVFSADECLALCEQIEVALRVAADPAESIRDRAGVVYAGRNLLDVFPGSREAWRRPVVLDFLQATVGEQAGLVRVLFFDKPPERSWSLPWHKDLTIAVRDNHRTSERFTKPTTKAGVPHVEAPLDVLQQMVTLRIHLDDMTDENGPLHVIPGSHHSKLGDNADVARPASPIAVHLRRGDIFAMRPLLTHSSTKSKSGTQLHRRILHLEFSGQPYLPDGFEWHNFVAAF